jgi:hypothetical protein
MGLVQINIFFPDQPFKIRIVELQRKSRSIRFKQQFIVLIIKKVIEMYLRGVLLSF